MEDNNKPQVLGNSEYFFVQSNEFIKARYKENLTFWEFVILGKMCTLIDSADEDFKEYEIQIRELIGFMELSDGGNVYKYILEAATRLLERRVIVSYKDDTGRRMILETNLIAGFAKPEKASKNEPLFVTITFHPHLKPFLLQLQRDFTKLDLRSYKFLRTGTSIRIYHLLKQYAGRRQYVVEVPLDELKEMLGVGDKYVLYGHFKSAVIEEAHKRLLETADISFAYQEVKKGRKVVAIVFHIKEKEEGAPSNFDDTVKFEPIHLKMEAQTDTYSLEHLQLFDQYLPIVCQKFGVSERMLHMLITNYEAPILEKALQITSRAFEAGKVKDVAGFFVEAVRGSYADNAEEEQKRQAELKKNKAKAEQTAASLNKQRDNARKLAFEQEKMAAFALINTNDAVRTALIEHLKSGLISTLYQDEEGLDNNLKHPSILGAALNFVKKYYEKG